MFPRRESPSQTSRWQLINNKLESPVRRRNSQRNTLIPNVKSLSTVTDFWLGLRGQSPVLGDEETRLFVDCLTNEIMYLCLNDSRSDLSPCWVIETFITLGWHFNVAGENDINDVCAIGRLCRFLNNKTWPSSANRSQQNAWIDWNWLSAV